MSSTGFGALTVAEFVQRLASSEPVPGGGSASAVAGSLAAALIVMVASLSQDRPAYAAHERLHQQAIDVGSRLAGRLIELADEDATAYAGYAAALKLPRNTDAERDARRQAMSAAARDSSIAPLRCVEACAEVVSFAEALAGRSNRNASSDLEVAATLGEAAARGAAANVIVNLPSVGDESWEGEQLARVQGLLEDIERTAALTRETVRSGVSREPIELPA